MKVGIFAVYDRKSECFGDPMFVPTRGQALRSISDAVNERDPKNVLRNHAEDFEFYWLGDYENGNGSFTGSPELVIKCLDLLKVDN